MVDCSTQWVQRYRNLCQQKQGEDVEQLVVDCQPNATNEWVNNVKQQMIDNFDGAVDVYDWYAREQTSQRIRY